MARPCHITSSTRKSGPYPSVPVRQGRRLRWIDAALAPAGGRIPDPQASRLRNALATVIGVEPVSSLRDICRLSAEEIEDCLAWTARSIIRATLAGTPMP